MLGKNGDFAVSETLQYVSMQADLVCNSTVMVYGLHDRAGTACAPFLAGHVKSDL